MSRFVAPDLASLPDLPLVTVDYDTTESERRAYYIAALAEYGIDYDNGEVETDPIRIAYSEGGGFVEMLIDQRINEAIRDLTLAKGRLPALQHIAGTYYGISYQDGEDIERFRDRIALAPEAFSTAGPEGAYIFHGLELDGIADVADIVVYSEEDGATYSDVAIFADAYTAGRRATPFDGRGDGDPVLAPEILVIVLPTVAYGPADQALLDRVFAAITSDDVRPCGDNVRIEPAEVLDYTIEMTVTYLPGADPAPLVAEAEKRATAYSDARRRIGVKAERLGIGGKGYVTNDEAVGLTSPSEDVGGGPKQAPNCTGITVTPVQAQGSWT